MKQLSIAEIAEAMNITEKDVEETLDSAMFKILRAFRGSTLSEKEKLSALIDVLSEQNYGNTKR
jgi:hypothetical protein